ncbi:MAG: hypothetical protein VR70_04215 [Rhodospirillaceae bacterium BRH_c57]|nr:MAG: hypothetical protein VR70_04215 [Rhodospirillaceae bacterium BRH_c57]
MRALGGGFKADVGFGQWGIYQRNRVLLAFGAGLNWGNSGAAVVFPHRDVEICLTQAAGVPATGPSLLLGHVRGHHLVQFGLLGGRPLGAHTLGLVEVLAVRTTVQGGHLIEQPGLFLSGARCLLRCAVRSIVSHFTVPLPCMRTKAREQNRYP